MLWQFTRYNGEVWEAKSQMDLLEAYDCFIKETGCTAWDIKSIINLH
jgi:hypothetical protein